MIQREVKNPHVTTFVTVTSVETSPDLHHAKVFISLIMPDAEKPKVIAALQSAAGFIAVKASEKVELRYFPQLTFYIDNSIEDHLKVQKILSQIEEERKSRPETNE